MGIFVVDKNILKISYRIYYGYRPIWYPYSIESIDWRDIKTYDIFVKTCIFNIWNKKLGFKIHDGYKALKAQINHIQCS